MERVRISCDIPDGKSESSLPDTTTEGILLFCWLARLRGSATEMTIGDSGCVSSSDTLFAVKTANNQK